jgi:hypothetical protein
MGKIPIGICGRILTSEHPNMRVRVQDDAKNTGGFLIYSWWDGSTGPNESGVFDDWVESEADLEQYFAESGWSVEWEQV